jgi:N-hydroxyarylamine O-acetyltransferase
MVAGTNDPRGLRVRQYLERISWEGSLATDESTLRALHLAHLRRVPFENLDIPLGRPIGIGVTDSFGKVVSARRGGFCYELNGLFGWLLRQLGFVVTYLSAGVARQDGSFGPDFDHLTLRVWIPGQSGDRTGWLADIGFGDSFLEPLPLIPGKATEQQGHAYKLVERGSTLHLLCLDETTHWRPQYRFTLQERKLADFVPMSLYHQRSPESSFTQRSLATIATHSGRVTLADSRLVTTRDGAKVERAIAASDYQATLKRHFGITLPEADVRRLTTRFA